MSSYHSYSLDKTTNTIVVDNSLNFLYDPKKHPPVSLNEIVTSLFNKTTFIIFIGFLAIYFIFYFVLGGFYGPLASSKILKTQSINFTILALFIFGGLYFYYSLPKSDQNDFIRYTMLLFQDEMNDPNTIFIMTEFLILFYIFVFIFGFSMTKEDKAFSLHIIELKSWIYLVMLIFICFFIYVLNIEIVDLVYFEFYRILDSWKKLYGDKDDVTSTKVVPKTTPAASPSPSTSTVAVPVKTGGQEVFNVSSNQYTYDDAQAICKAYGARLAKYDEIEQAYEAGAEWCNYGWSDGQMAYFPTQKSTWDALQKDPSKQHNCGRPGINGGYINNPAIKFGVNCYGIKPPPNEMEKNMLNSTMVSQPNASSPAAAVTIDANVEKWKRQMDSLTVNSYNHKEWSQYS